MMDDEKCKRFLRYYWRNLVSFAIDLAELDDKEREAVELCGRKRLTIEQAAEAANPPVSPNTMQTRWRCARMRLRRVWADIEWINILADTVE